MAEELPAANDHKMNTEKQMRIIPAIYRIYIEVAESKSVSGRL